MIVAVVGVLAVVSTTLSPVHAAESPTVDAAGTIRDMLSTWDPAVDGEIPEYDFEDLKKLAEDPDFIAQSGETDEERDAAMDRFRSALDDFERTATELRDSGEIAEVGTRADDAPKADDASPTPEPVTATPADGAPLEPTQEELTAAWRDEQARQADADLPTAESIPDDAGALAVIEASNEAAAGVGRVNPDPEPEPETETGGVLAEFQAKQGWKQMLAAMSRPPEALPLEPALPDESTPGDEPTPEGFHIPDPPGSCSAWPGGPTYPLTFWPAPQTNTVRPGTILYPLQNTYLVPPTPQVPQHTVFSQLGSLGLETRIVNGVEQFRVMGHLAERSLGLLLGWHRPIIKVVDGNGNSYNFAPGSPGTEIRIKCYPQDVGGTFVNRGLVDAWIPFRTANMNLGEPGFQVRFESVDALGGTPPLFFLGGDQRTANIGAAPNGYRAPVQNALAVGVATGFIHDTNANPADDLEHLAREALSVNNVSNLLGSMEGREYRLGPNSSFYFRLNNTEVKEASSDLDTKPTWIPNTTTADDEYRIWLRARFGGVMAEGSFSYKIKIKIFGWWIVITVRFCYAKVRANLEPVARTSLDIAPPTGIRPDAEVNTTVDVYHKLLLGGPLCLLANLIPNAIVENILSPALSKMVVEKAGGFAATTGDLIDNVQPRINVGQGGLQARVTRLLTTCQPLGCNGYGAGDILLGAEGLEPAADVMVTDLKQLPWWGWPARRFPHAYQPTTPRTAQQIVRDHANPAYDLAAAINPGVLNQAFRSLVEGGQPTNSGLLDLQTNDFWARPDVPPFYYEFPNLKRTVGFLLPDYRFGSADGANSWAMNLYAGADVRFDPATSTLGAGVTAVNPIAQVDIQVVRCSLVFYLLCAGIPALATTVVNYLSSVILPTLIGNAVGVVRLPEVAGYEIRSVDVRRVARHLAVYLDIGASRVWVNGGTGPTGWDFDALADMAGTGPVATTWTVRDDIAGAPIPFQTSPGIIGPTSHVHVDKAAARAIRFRFGSWWYEVRVVTATVIASRGGVTRTASLQLAIFDRV